MKSWLKKLSIEYIYAEQNPNRTWDIWFQSWPFRSEKRIANSTKFWLWRPVPGKWAATWGFMAWLFLSWGIDYQIKNKKTQSGRITSWNFVHPISHCEVSGRWVLNEPKILPNYQPCLQSIMFYLLTSNIQDKKKSIFMNKRIIWSWICKKSF